MVGTRSSQWAEMTRIAFTPGKRWPRPSVKARAGVFDNGRSGAPWARKSAGSVMARLLLMELI